jgi:exopolyphosphatase/guanosine-5'-triphosphate,3'-diphosphate pyrophosphatase
MTQIMEELRLPLELQPEQRLRQDIRHVAVVDVGSNSVRLVVYDSLSRAPFPRFNEKSLCGLGAGLNETGKLSDEAMSATLRAMRRYAAIARAMDAERIDVLATEAVRRAANSRQLIAAMARESGLKPRVLSGSEEAHFAALGVVAGFYRPRGLIGDMGGGSVEVAEVVDDRVGERSVSLPLGALPVSALLARHGRAAKDEVDAIIGDRLPPPLTEPVFHPIGGGWRALARVHMALADAPVKVAHGYELDAKEARAFAKKVWRMSKAEVAALPDVPSRRISTLPAAALVLDRVLRKLRPERIVFSALGLREGWLYDQLPEDQRYLDPLVEGAQAFGTPRARVPAFGAALVRWTDTLFPGETHAEKRLRVAACALSDIAWIDHQGVRASHSFDRVLSLPFVGLTHAERLFLGVTLHERYDGAADDPILQPAQDKLSPAQLRQAKILGRTILLGYRFSGVVPEILGLARLRIEADLVRLEVDASANVPDSDAVRARMRQLAKAVGVTRGEVTEVSAGSAART